MEIDRIVAERNSEAEAAGVAEVKVCGCCIKASMQKTLCLDHLLEHPICFYVFFTILICTLLAEAPPSPFVHLSSHQASLYLAGNAAAPLA